MAVYHRLPTQVRVRLGIPRDERRIGGRQRVRASGSHLRLDLRGEGGCVARRALDGVRRQRLQGTPDLGEYVALLMRWMTARGRGVVQVSRRKDFWS